jgi:hypothetical protein
MAAPDPSTRTCGRFPGAPPVFQGQWIAAVRKAMTRSLLSFAAAAGALALAAGLASDALAADSTDVSVDSLQAGEADSTSIEALAAKLSVGPAWEVHPDYSVKINKRKDVTNWDTRIGMGKDFTDKLSMTVTGVVNTRENTTLNRSDAANGASASLKYKLNNSINLGMAYNTNLSAYRYDLRRDAPADRKQNLDANVSSELTRKLFDAIDVNMRAVAGSTSNSFASVSNKGRRQDLTASVAFAPTDALRTSTTYTGSRLFLDSQVTGAAGNFATKDRTFSQNLGFTLSYEMLPGIQFGVDASSNQDRRQHPDPATRSQETESKSSTNASITSSFDMLKRITWNLGVKFADAEGRYVVRNKSNSETRSADLTAGARVLPWRGANVNLSGEREVSREKFVTPDTDRNLHKSLSFKLAQNLGAEADMELTAMSDLISVFYDSTDANPRDRDRLSNRVAVDVKYRPFTWATTALGSEVSGDRTTYVKSQQSANNRNATRYRVYGNYNLTVRDISIIQNYDIGATYTLYQYVPANGSLVRNSNINTSFRIPVAPELDLNLDHAYKLQDQGSYVRQGHRRLYGRTAQSISNSFAITMRYTLIKRLNLIVRQAYYLQSSWAYTGGRKYLRSSIESSEISGRLGFKHQIGERSHISCSVERSWNEGSAVSAAFRRYWNLEIEASHVF